MNFASTVTKAVASPEVWSKIGSQSSNRGSGSISRNRNDLRVFELTFRHNQQKGLAARAPRVKA